MELKIGTRVRCKNTGAVGVIIDAPSYIDLYLVDFGVRAEWLLAGLSEWRGQGGVDFGARAEWLEPKDLEAVENGDA
jgi:hypothetical protein